MRKQALRAVAASAVAVAGVTAAGPLAEGASASSDPSGWAALRMCESSGNYAANTGNGYYGAYQFDLSTWASLGFSGLPSSASPAVQDLAAQELYAQRGSEPWPVCGRYLSGVSASAPAATTVAAPVATTTTTSAPSSDDPDGDSDDPPAAPAPQAAPAAPASTAGWSSYTVQPGDTLWWLAIDHHTTVSALASVNHIANPNLILVGQVLEV